MNDQSGAGSIRRVNLRALGFMRFRSAWPVHLYTRLYGMRHILGRTNGRSYLSGLLLMFSVLLSASCIYVEQSSEKDRTGEAYHDTLHPIIHSGVQPQSDSIRKYSGRLEKYYITAEPAEIAEACFLPFDIKDRSSLSSISVISTYGSARSSHLKGHKHSGADIIPAGEKDSRNVYAAAAGVVCFINQRAPFKTVILKHKLKDGTVIFSSYIHLKEIFIHGGQQVDAASRIGVLYTRNEALTYGGNYDHLHFEIKKRIDDYSCASWLCMSHEELNEYFCDPVDFFRKYLHK